MAVWPVAHVEYQSPGHVRLAPPVSPSPDAGFALLEEQLARALRAFAAGGPVTDGLRDAISSYVRCMRDRGEPPERAVIAFKRVLAAALPVSRRASEQFVGPLVSACIDAFYAAR